MNRLRNNIIANFGGQAWAMVMGIAFVPVYLDVLGIEAYGLIGLFLSLQAFFLILDAGLSATLNRELARSSHAGLKADEVRDLVRSLEWIYWPGGLVIAVAVFLVSNQLAQSWLQPVALSSSRTAQAIVLMGVAAALQWPCGLYSGGLRGLERQVLLNGLSASFATLRSLGAVAILMLFSPTLEAFLWWHVFVGALQTLVFRASLWRLLPSGSRQPALRWTQLRGVRSFALGMSGIVALSFLLTQSDRIILSRLLPLSDFGYYAVALTVAAALSSVVQPFFSSLYPRYSYLVAAGDDSALRKLYHESNQLLIVIVASAASVLAFFAIDVLRIWTQDAELAQKSGPILSILVAGTALNGLMNLPFALQLAHGSTRLALNQNIAAVLLVIPATWFLANRYGGIGAAFVWLLLNLAYVTICIPIMHRQILVGELGKWYRTDFLPPAFAAVGTAAAAKAIAPELHGWSGAFAIALIGGVCLCVSLAFAPATRLLLQRHWAARTS